MYEIRTGWAVGLALGLALGCVPKSAIPLPGGGADDDVDGDDVSGDDDTMDDDSTGDDDQDCDYAEITPDPDGSLWGAVGLTQDIQPVIDAGCDCHQVGNPALEDLSPGKVWTSWVEQPSSAQPEHSLVAPADPEASVVFWKLLGCYPLFPYTGESMPPNAAQLSIGELTAVYNWILQGAADN